MLGNDNIFKLMALIVNWIKGEEKGKKSLIEEVGTKTNATLLKTDVDSINSSLTSKIDLSSAKTLKVNAISKACYQGQTHGHSGFLLDPKEASRYLQLNHENNKVIYPYLTADELFRSKPPSPQRYVIDFHPLDIITASKYKELFKIVEESVLPTRQEAANQESIRNEEALKVKPDAKINKHHEKFLNKWWLLSYPREDLISKLNDLDRYIVCGQVTKRPIFEFISSSIRPNAALIVFPLEDDYSFGVLQSVLHWEWFKAKCSTLTERYRYTSNTVFDTFPWPQSPTLSQVNAVARAGYALRKYRTDAMGKNDLSLRDIYRTFDKKGSNPLKDKHATLDKAVMDAYGMKKTDDPLKFLFELNDKLAKKEFEGEMIAGPGLPKTYQGMEEFKSDDCVTV